MTGYSLRVRLWARIINLTDSDKLHIKLNIYHEFYVQIHIMKLSTNVNRPKRYR